MGLHTRFYKDKVLYEEYKELYDKLDKCENFETYLDDIEIFQIDQRISEIETLNKTEYHDLFRTSKREVSNGEYTLDVIYSKIECFKWLEDNKDLVSFKNTIFDSDEEEKKLKYNSYKRLKEFWEKYPDGVIDFG